MNKVYFENRPVVVVRSGSLEERPGSARKMDEPLSAYWVKFFKNAGFSTEVATRYALIFSNNRIKPDMLPELDKPSLKEMGITLMGDMIAILRYAKKVVDETTTKKFLVSSEDSPTTTTVKTVAKPVVKKVITKTVAKAPASTKVKMETASLKTVKSSTNTNLKSVTVKKKVPPPITQTSRLYSDYIDTTKPKITSLKRKYDSEEEDNNGKWVHNDDLNMRPKTLKTSDTVGFKVMMPKETTVRSQKILKKALEQKRTVFHRLGDSMVSSTTSIAETSNSNFSPNFNVTGIGKEALFKRTNSSVFNRLGNKDDDDYDDISYTRHLKNGSLSSGTQGILKTRTPFLGTKVITTKQVLKKPIGTMRADEEASRKKSVTVNVKQLVRSTPSLKFNDSPLKNSTFVRKVPFTGKLASERIAVPAKSRLGVSKQVTFNKMATINHIKKQGVFSRLGV